MKNVFLLVALSLMLQSCSKEKEKVLYSATVTSVALSLYPLKNNGAEWDNFSSFPDPYFTVIKSGYSQVYFESTVFDEAAQGAATWQTDFLLLPDQLALITFYDEDGANDDLIGSIYVDTDALKGAGYPAQMLFNGDNGCQAVLEIEYIFR